ncbi:hypothetical protein ACFQ4L_02585 [Lapidilactobacillus mulanensis]|uniref:DUF806 family protein n=1 Tax=Lapidilactobacillus mulanensis TaxID=2485999 RepID=A0ABW4DK55_9LACO|nr:hypothetical protein [Lapidilactobacillus mulanensis]
MTHLEITEKLIQFILTAPEVVREPRVYSNQVTYAFSDKLPVPGQHQLFPEMRLHVERLNYEFVEQQYAKIDQLFKQTRDTVDNQKFADVWLTTSHLTDRGLYLVEFSFE